MFDNPWRLQRRCVLTWYAVCCRRKAKPFLARCLLTPGVTQGLPPEFMPSIAVAIQAQVNEYHLVRPATWLLACWSARSSGRANPFALTPPNSLLCGTGHAFCTPTTILGRLPHPRVPTAGHALRLTLAVCVCFVCARSACAITEGLVQLGPCRHTRAAAIPCPKQLVLFQAR